MHFNVFLGFNHVMMIKFYFSSHRIIGFEEGLLHNLATFISKIVDPENSLSSRNRLWLLLFFGFAEIIL